MKTRASAEDIVRLLVQEELRSVPEFLFREEAHKFAEAVKQHIKRFLLTSPNAGSEQQTNQAIAALDTTTQSLEAAAFELIESKLWEYMRQI